MLVLHGIYHYWTYVLAGDLSKFKWRLATGPQWPLFWIRPRWLQIMLLGHWILRAWSLTWHEVASTKEVVSKVKQVFGIEAPYEWLGFSETVTGNFGSESKSYDLPLVWVNSLSDTRVD